MGKGQLDKLPVQGGPLSRDVNREALGDGADSEGIGGGNERRPVGTTGPCPREGVK